MRYLKSEFLAGNLKQLSPNEIKYGKYVVVRESKNSNNLLRAVIMSKDEGGFNVEVRDGME
jgi:hypothetical protein